MFPYHKIQTIYKRNPATKFKTILEGEFALPEFEYLAHNEWELTEKVDGTNIRIIFDRWVLSFKGKTDNAQISPFLENKLRETFVPRLPLLEEMFPQGCCLYGEGFGNKIQAAGKNYIPDGQDFVLFDVRVGDWWLERDAVYQVADDLAIPSVPVVEYGNLWDATELVRAGFNSAWGNFTAEGVIARPTTSLFSRNGNRIIAKLKYKDFAR